MSDLGVVKIQFMPSTQLNQSITPLYLFSLASVYLIQSSGNKEPRIALTRPIQRLVKPWIKYGYDRYLLLTMTIKIQGTILINEP